MFYFMCIMTLICVVNLLVMASVAWKFGFEVFMTIFFKSLKDIAVERTQRSL